MKLNIELIWLTLLSLVRSKIVPFDDWEHQRVALKDVNIHLRYAGAGPPLLLVHGFPQHSVCDKESRQEIY